jgi:mannitol/fructose-specific phosphotransferase system IIA component (Ntr-type)
VSEALAPAAGVTREEVEAGLQERERLGSTVLTQGLAVPHMLLPGSRKFALVVARCLRGIRFGEDEDAKAVHSIFVLAATQDERNFHLKALSAVAQIWQSGDFEASWKKAANETELRELLLKARRLRV